MIKLAFVAHFLADYLYTEQEVQEFQLGPVITPIGDSVCLSMFVSMCASCSLKVILWPRRFTFRAQGQTSEAKEVQVPLLPIFFKDKIL